MPLDLVDTATGIDYFKAATRFAQLGNGGCAHFPNYTRTGRPTARILGRIFPNLPATRPDLPG